MVFSQAEEHQSLHESEHLSSEREAHITLEFGKRQTVKGHSITF